MLEKKETIAAEPYQISQTSEHSLGVKTTRQEQQVVGPRRIGSQGKRDKNLLGSNIAARLREPSIAETQQSLGNDTPQFKQPDPHSQPFVLTIHHQERLKEVEPDVIKTEDSEEMRRFSLIHGARNIKKKDGGALVASQEEAKTIEPKKDHNWTKTPTCIIAFSDDTRVQMQPIIRQTHLQTNKSASELLQAQQKAYQTEPQMVIVRASRNDMKGILSNIHLKMLETSNLEDQINHRPLASHLASPSRRSVHRLHANQFLFGSRSSQHLKVPRRESRKQKILGSGMRKNNSDLSRQNLSAANLNRSRQSQTNSGAGISPFEQAKSQLGAVVPAAIPAQSRSPGDVNLQAKSRDLSISDEPIHQSGAQKRGQRPFLGFKSMGFKSGDLNLMDYERHTRAQQSLEQDRSFYAEQVMVWDVQKVNQLTGKGGNALRRSRSHGNFQDDPLQLRKSYQRQAAQFQTAGKPPKVPLEERKLRKEPSDPHQESVALDNTPSSVQLRVHKAEQAHFEYEAVRGFDQQKAAQIIGEKDSIDAHTDSDTDYDAFIPAGGGVMMWDDDEQFIPQPEPILPQTITKPMANALADEQRNSLVFSTEDLQKDYQKLHYVSKEWSRKQDQRELRKTTNMLLDGSPLKALADSPAKDPNTLMPERAAINALGKSLMQLSQIYKPGGIKGARAMSLAGTQAQ